MSDAILFVKKEILSFLEDNKSDVGDALNMRGLLHQRIIHWNPKQKDALTAAANELVVDGFLEEKNSALFLSQKGVDQLYPSVGDSVKIAVLSSLSNSNSRVGDRLNARAFMHQHILNWNPKQKAALDSELQKLANDGLIDLKDGDIFLTQKGFDTLY
jgi:hypothetical protein